MSVEEFETKLKSTYPLCWKDRQKLNELIEEYNHIKGSHEETYDSKKMVAKAYQLLIESDVEISKIITLMRLAVKIIKSCNGIRN